MIYFVIAITLVLVSLVTSFFDKKWLQIVSKVSNSAAFGVVLYTIYND